ncbi:MAG TPA: cysteine synthase A [Coriobacteriia bacterium]|nr:cysteine synthase A [Coriobacteriia bacterium]
MTLHPSITDTIGNTPLVRLGTIAEGLPATVALKLESHNPGGSVKDRVARNMIDDAEKRGVIVRGRSVIVEPTSGNTGVGLAMVGAARGYRVIITMPESMSVERRTLLRAFGADLVLTPRERGMAGAIEAATEIAAATDGAFIPGQFENPANPAAHYATTGPEIEHALGDEPLGAFVAGVGTGGTFTGVSRYLRDRGIAALRVAVEPAESRVIAQHLAGETPAPSPHGIQGIGAGFVPAVLDVGLIDDLQHVTAEEAIAMARRLAAEEGMLVGISSGANVAAALRIARRPELAGTVVVTVAPSTGERYLSTPLWQGLAE